MEVGWNVKTRFVVEVGQVWFIILVFVTDPYDAINLFIFYGLRELLYLYVNFVISIMNAIANLTEK